MTRVGVMLCLCISSIWAQNFKSSTISATTARQIGPAVMSGRITAIEGNPQDPNILYIGTAAGGIWKSYTGGTLFKPVFDKHAQSIGALALDPQHPDTLWAGTGESNMRNSVSVGDGIYRSTDAGENWVKTGLEKSEHISKIIVHPKDPATVYAAVPGALWSDSEERGLFKTTDFGKTWERILYHNPRSGCADVIMDPRNPDVLYASMWEFRRTPWSFTSGGEGSGLYKSNDGGKTWKQIQKGFVPGILGRICLALAPSAPDHVYAIAEGKETFLYSSIDAGENWTKESAIANVTARPFYFSVIQVDPIDSMRVYRPAFNLSVSDDGGKSFYDASMQGGWVHPDHHALWINPQNNKHMFLGTDGGVYVSFDRGINWLFLSNLPVSQFYHVSYDLQTPYNVYGGLQDNGSWMGPSESEGGIDNSDWENLFGGDGFWVQPDLTNPDIVFCEYQGGNMVRVNVKTKDTQSIKPEAASGEPKLRFNWNTPLLTAPGRPHILYTGAQYVYRSSNKGYSWEKISPDLTTNDPAKQKQEESGGLSVDNSSAENHCTVFTIAESVLDSNLVWAGTDDGNLQVTTDGGKRWTNVVNNIQDLPKNTWVSSIMPSQHVRNRVYVSFDGHATGDLASYLFVSEDLGASWARITKGDINSFAHKIIEDPVNPNLLFAGTEMGLFMSIDRGQNWVQHKYGVPPTPVRDLGIHPVTHDLIIASHGRGIMILDDLSPFRSLDESMLNAPVTMLPARKAIVDPSPFGAGFPAAGGFTGPNPDKGARIWYYLKDRVQTGDVTIRILNTAGEEITSIPGTKRKGVNMISWNMRGKPPRVAAGAKADFSGFFGPVVPPGNYIVELNTPVGNLKDTLPLFPPAYKGHSFEDMQTQVRLVQDIFRFQEDMAYLSYRIRQHREKVQNVMGKTGISDSDKRLLTSFDREMESIHQLLSASKETTAITGEEKIREQLSSLYLAVSGYAGKPTESQFKRFTALQAEYQKAVDRYASAMDKNQSKVSNVLKKYKSEVLQEISRVDFDAIK